MQTASVPEEEIDRHRRAFFFTRIERAGVVAMAERQDVWRGNHRDKRSQRMDNIASAGILGYLCGKGLSSIDGRTKAVALADCLDTPRVELYSHRLNSDGVDRR